MNTKANFLKQPKRKSSEKLFDPKRSLVKMILFPHDETKHPLTRYSSLKVDKEGGVNLAITHLEKMANSADYQGFWRTAMFYCNQTRAELKKIIHNGKVKLYNDTVV